MSNPIVRLKEAGKTYRSGDVDLTVLHPVTLDMHERELILLMGPSGSGKTTLLSLIGCVIYPTVGNIYIGDLLINGMSERELANVRLERIGFIFQNYNLLAPLTALENVMFPMQLQQKNYREAHSRALEVIKEVQMEHRLDSLPRQLSGGEQQRIAIARALVTDPSILLCDEPTGALDKASGDRVMDILKRQAAKGKCVVVVTHDQRLLTYADRTLYMENGFLSDQPSD
ncbi:MAG: ABC transporter ATP-binding protein [Bacteroidales bacterium]